MNSPDMLYPSWLTQVPTTDTRCNHCYGTENPVVAFFTNLPGTRTYVCSYHAQSLINGYVHHNIVAGQAISSLTYDNALLHGACVECGTTLTFERWATTAPQRNALMAGQPMLHCHTAECGASYSPCPECRVYTHVRDGHYCPPSPTCGNCERRMTVVGYASERRSGTFVLTDPETGESITHDDWCIGCHRDYVYECSGCEHLHSIAAGVGQVWTVYRNSRDYRRGDYSGRISEHCLDTGGFSSCDGHGIVWEGDHENDEGELPCCDSQDLEDILNGYSFTPEPEFHGEGKLFLGMELEITSEHAVRTARTAQKGFGQLVYLKDDSSIRGEGFEMVTHPMEYMWALSSVDWSTLNRMRASGGYEDDSCGIHVHASRAGFSGPAHDFRWLAFFDRNREQLTVLARRSSSSYAVFGQKTPSDMRKIAKKEHISRRRRRDMCSCGCEDGPQYRTEGLRNRYQAINPTNEHTYEVRIFATSLDPQEVRAALGLVHATIEYTRVLRARDVMKSDGMSWGAFVKWVAPRAEYADLMAEITKYNLMEV